MMIGDEQVVGAGPGRDGQGLAAPGRRGVTIRAMLLSVFGVLALLTAWIAGSAAIREWQDTRRIAVVSAASQVSDAILEAAGALAQERGSTNGALNAAPVASTDVLAAIAGRRQAADQALERALQLLPATGLGTGADGLAASLVEARKSVAQLRHDADGQLAKAKAKGERNVAVVQAWFPGITRLVMAALDLRLAVVRISAEIPALAEIETLRSQLATASEFAGRERGFMNGVIAAGRPLSLAELTGMAEIRGHVLAAWSTAKVSVLGQAIGSEVQAAFHEADKAYFLVFETVRSGVFAASASQQPYPVDAANWWKSATLGIDAILKAQKDATVRALVLADQARAAAMQALLQAVIVLAASLAAILFGVWVVAAKVVAGIRALTRTMRALAGGNTAIEIDGANRRDELGEMSRAVLVFQQHARAVEQMTAERELQRQKNESERRRALISMADNIEGKTTGVVAHVAAETVRLLETAETMASSAKRVETSAQAVAAAADQSLANSQTVAGAAEELSVSIREIAAQVARSTGMVDHSVRLAQDAAETVIRLTDAMAAIDQVVGVISNIAGQTNLLALNATIEAARAGNAGKGFAVVANEVKTLAAQTAREAQDISQRLGGLGDMASQVRSAIGATVDSIHSVEAIVGAVAAAVEEQDAATKDIAHNVQQAATAAQVVSAHIGQVAEEAASTGEQAAVMERMVDAMAGKVTELGGALTQVLRTTAPEVDRRQGPRRPMRGKAHLGIADRTFEGQLRDVSPDGASVAGVPWGQAGDTAILTIGALAVPVTLVSRDNDIVHLRTAIPRALVPVLDRHAAAAA